MKNHLGRRSSHRHPAGSHSAVVPSAVPPDVVDSAGVPLEIGAVVRLLRGPLAGSVGEVARWVEGRGVEVIVPEPIPELVAVRPGDLTVLDVVPDHPIVRAGPTLGPAPR